MSPSPIKSLYRTVTRAVAAVTKSEPPRPPFDTGLVLIRSTKSPLPEWHHTADPHSGLCLDLLRCLVGVCVSPATLDEVTSRIRTDAFSTFSAFDIGSGLQLLIDHEVLTRFGHGTNEVFAVNPKLTASRKFSPVAQATYAVCLHGSEPREVFVRVRSFRRTTPASVQATLRNMTQRGYLRCVARAAYARPLDAAKHQHPAYATAVLRANAPSSNHAVPREFTATAS